MEEVVVNGQVENVVQDCPESGVVAETRRTRTNMAADDETMAMELEEEFQRLCGREDQAESLQVCMRVGKAIRNVEVLVMAEVAKYMRCGHPGREGIEQVGREATEAAIEELALLRMKCKESTVIGKWVQVVLESLECDSRAEGVEQLAELLEIREEVRRLSGERGMGEREFLRRCEGVFRENESLQETLRAQLEELSELRELKSRFAAQERELQQMRRKLDSEAPEASGKHRSIDVLNVLRPEKKVVYEADLLQNGISTAAQRQTTMELEGSSRQRKDGISTGESMSARNTGMSAREASVSGLERDSQMAHYLKYLALPEVRPFSGEDPGYSFGAFLESFALKYPRSAWSDRELCALFRAKLTGKAKTQYEALPLAVREGCFETQADALRRECRAELRSHKILALGELRRLRKKEGQSVADFCLELERLTRQAHPHLDEAALDTERAQLLYDQLAHWSDSYHLLEALEYEEHAYDKLKQTALRIERRNWTLRNTGVSTRTGGGNNAERGRSKSGVPEVQAGTPKDTNEGTGRFGTRKRPQLCYICHEPGHLAKDCTAREQKLSSTERQPATSLSARLAQLACNKIEVDDSEGVTCPLVGRKHTTTVEAFGRKWTGLLDTGSEVSLLPAAVLLAAKNDGLDIDREVTEHRMDHSVRVCDASGGVMSFVAVVEVKLKEGTNPPREVVANMYVTKDMNDIIILGTNVLPALGYELCRQSSGDWKRGKRGIGQGVGARQGQLREYQPGVAYVAQRMYVAPGATSWVRLRGSEERADCFLTSCHELIHSGVCRVGIDGIVEIPVVNRGPEPAVFRVGEAVGRWEEEKEDWNEVTRGKVPPDLLGLPPNGENEDRLAALKGILTEYREDKVMPEELWRVLEESHNVFAMNDWELTQTNLVTHEIDTGGTAPIRQRTRPVPIGARTELKAILKGLLERGIIERSHSPWASPVVLVRKKDGTLRLCVDYRELNKNIRQDAYPLPTVDAMLQSLQGKRVFTSLDLCSGYWQIPLSADAKAKSAFTTSEGLFEFTVLPFGLSTSPAEFQRLMDGVLGERKGQEVFVYIDDILVATESEQRHYEVLREVLQALGKANLKLKPQKCTFLEREIAFLGHRVDGQGVRVDPDKVEKIQRYPRPTKLAEMRTFLGMCGYYRKFIWNFAEIARPLFDLTSQKVSWKWGEEQEEAFNRLRAALTTTPVLVQPDAEGARSGRRPFVIYTDASQRGIGAVLCQEGEDTLLHPLYFASRSLTKAERNYHVTDAEALAVVFALRKFHFFVYDMEVIIRTDHLPLTALFKRTNISARVLRWALEIQQYRVKIEYVKGKANPVADALSRGIPCGVEEEVAKDEESDRVVCAVSVGTETEWLAELAVDREYSNIVQWVRQGDVDREVRLPRMSRRLKVADFVLEDGILKVIKEDGETVAVVPKSRRRQVFDEAHRGNLAGHFAARKITRLLRKRVFWEGMDQDIAKWVRECRECFLTNPRQALRPGLRPMMATKPFELVCVDLLEMGLSASGMKYVVVLVDHFTKWLGAYAIPNKSAAEVATVIYQRWICENGRWPRRLHSDQGTEFLNKTMEELAKVAGIETTTTRGYDSRANGLCERAIGTLQRILKEKTDFPDYWDSWLPNAVYAYNVTPHEGTGESPFFLVHGFDPYIPSRVIPEGIVAAYPVDLDDYKTELLRGFRLISEEVQRHAEKYREDMKRCFDNKHGVDQRRLPRVGARVFMKLPRERARSKHPKLAVDWDGPFRVLETSENSALITRIGKEEEPLRIQMDLLRVCPEELSNDPVKVISRRKRRGRRCVQEVRAAMVRENWTEGCYFSDTLQSDGMQDSYKRREDGRMEELQARDTELGGSQCRMIIVIPAVLRALKRIRGFKSTEMFFYRSFRDIHMGKAALFVNQADCVIVVLPPEEAGAGSWTALVEAVSVWLAGGRKICLVAGPRTGDDNAWFAVTRRTRECMEAHVLPQHKMKIIDSMPARPDDVDIHAPWYETGVIGDGAKTIQEWQARIFYRALRRQLSPHVRLEALPDKCRREGGRCPHAGEVRKDFRNTRHSGWRRHGVRRGSW